MYLRGVLTFRSTLFSLFDAILIGFKLFYCVIDPQVQDVTAIYVGFKVCDKLNMADLLVYKWVLSFFIYICVI